ncbi:ABC transporter substrate-binding protein [Aurantimonas sp. VKM B-3413]|uniref:ABC transporter substrate-binding protein n=1 Tax=Aurantimonas sp. VKM B-3413 TaxID=2779401 RepID=UPI001E5DCA8C|nr:ABC transporter substrate-binding protein [Aurantimonas sp. VKM B-3413]MCB8838300.1 ABC transporter substrate-binding protein [Aurantimonas sp. VKM B-3413]
MKSRSLTAASLALGAAILTSSLAFADDTVRVMAPTWPGFAPVFVAMDKGYFKDLGLDVQFTFEDDRSNVLAAMARGDIDVDMRTVGEHQGRPRTPETPGKIIGTIDKSVGGDGVIAAGSIDTVADLKGKKIAAEPNIPARLLLQLALKKVGLKLSDLSIVDIATADTVAVFSDDSIAAVATYEPFMSQSVKALPNRKPKILISSKDSDIIVDVITARDADLDENPEKYAKFLAGIYKAIDLYKSNPDEFIADAAPHYNLSDAEVKDILDTSLAYTDLAESRTLIGTADKPGTLTGIFDTVMQLNLENGAAEVELKASEEIDPKPMSMVEDGMVKG